ncbi:uncharacterized protein [Nicotiana sylvestris]|uniref:uncharacterized protein n=1 Tax=Nicotiana sylvestris TaxID=4096 RepID=UPI00388CA5D5
MLTIFSHDAYALIDPGSTLSCLTPFVAGKFGIVSEIVSDPFAVSTLVRESIIARRVYRGCTVSVCDRQTSADLVELEMLDFDAIMDMEWLAAFHATVHCRAKIARFHFPGEPALEWVGNAATPRGRFISYLKARKMIAKGCIYHILRVIDVDAEIPTLQSIPVLKEYAYVFLDELPGIPPEREMDFGIDLLPGTQPISIPPYRMAPSELKELKEQLKDLLDKGFIKPSTSPWGAPVLYVAFLGHIVSDGGITVDNQKIEAVKSYPRPTTLIEIPSFLGLAGYYRRWNIEMPAIIAIIMKIHSL